MRRGRKLNKRGQACGRGGDGLRDACRVDEDCLWVPMRSTKDARPDSSLRFRIQCFSVNDTWDFARQSPSICPFFLQRTGQGGALPQSYQHVPYGPAQRPSPSRIPTGPPNPCRKTPTVPRPTARSTCPPYYRVRRCCSLLFDAYNCTCSAEESIREGEEGGKSGYQIPRRSSFRLRKVSHAR